MFYIGSAIKKRKFGKVRERAERKFKAVPEGVRGIVRLAESDIDGTKKVGIALTKIKGVGMNFAANIATLAGVNPDVMLGSLPDEDMKKLEDVVRNPLKYGFPEFMLNRRKDRETGETKHVIASSLVIAKKDDIDTMKKIHCYSGIRHDLGLPVRGQRTRGSFRTGRTTGVVKKKQQPGKRPTTKAPAKGKK